MVREREPLGRRSVRTFSVLTVGRVLSLLIGIATVVIIARLLGPSGYGVFTIAFAFFMFVSAASNFGFGQYLIKHLSEAEDRRDKEAFAKSLGAAFVAVVGIGLVLTVIGIAASGPVSGLLNISGVDQPLLVIAASIVFFAMMYGSSDYALVGVGKNAAAAAVEILENVVMLAASVALVLMGFGPEGAMAGILVSYLVAGAIGTYLIFRFARRSMRVRVNIPSARDLRKAFAFSLPIAGNNFLNNSMPSFGTLLLGFFVTAYDLGNFGIALRARTMLAIFYTTAAVSLIPTLTLAASRGGKSSGKLEHVYNKSMVYSVLASVPIITYLGVYSTALVYLFISQSFGTAPLYLSLIALGTIIGVVGVYATSMFIARAKTSKLIVYSGICAVAQVISLVLLVPSWGVLGAIVSLFFVESIVCDYLFLRGVKKVLGLRTDYMSLARAFVSNIAMALVFALGLYSSNLAVQLLFGLVALIIAYPFFLALFGSVRRDDMEILRRALGRLPVLRYATRPALAYLGFLVMHLQ